MLLNRQLFSVPYVLVARNQNPLMGVQLKTQILIGEPLKRSLTFPNTNMNNMKINFFVNFHCIRHP